MPDARLLRARVTLPKGYQFGDAAKAVKPPMPASPPKLQAPRHRLAGSHDGMFVTEHHRTAKK